MRLASIPVALIVVLSLAREAEAYAKVYRDCTVEVLGARYGFQDWRGSGFSMWTECCAGPLGSYEVPFTATQSLVGLCVTVTAFIAAAAVLTVRWKRNRGTIAGSANIGR